MKEFIDNLKFDDKGLLTAVVQDAQNLQLLMIAFMNAEAVQKTLETGKMHYWSRSRQELWLKGGLPLLQSGTSRSVRESMNGLLRSRARYSTGATVLALAVPVP